MVSLVLSSLLMPSPSMAVTMGKLKGMGGFRTMVIAVANLNIAMQQATINPHDVTRRKNVAVAYSMMPLAITALAKDFKSGQLHDGDFQFVQGILGGFVQKDLHSKVEDFMKDPSRQNMPSVGANFPQEALQQAEQSYIVANKEKSLLATNPDGSSKQAGLGGGSDLADLNRSPKIAGDQQSASAQTQAAETSTIVANKKKSLLNSSDVSELGSERSENTNSVNGVSEAQRGLASTVRVLSPVSTQNDDLDKDFFKEKKKKAVQDKKEKKVRKGSSLKNGAFWQTKRSLMLSSLLNVLFPTASATEQESNCQNCKGQGAGAGGGGGGGGGAAEILFGLAAMIAAASPMVAAAIQANADQSIAQTNANTAIQLANIQSAVAQDSINKQVDLAKFNAQATQQIAAEKNQKEMAIFNQQVNQLAADRAQQASLIREERALAQANLDREIAQQQALADAKQRFDEQQRQAKLVEAGLIPRGQTLTDSSQRLSISPASYGTASNTLASNNTLATNRNNSLNNNSGFVGPLRTANTANVNNNTANSNMGLAFRNPNSVVANNQVITASRGLKSPSAKTAQALLVAAVQPKTSSLNPQPVVIPGMVATLSKPTSIARGVAQVAQGSTRGFRQRINVKPGSLINDSSKYIAGIQPALVQEVDREVRVGSSESDKTFKVGNSHMREDLQRLEMEAKRALMRTREAEDNYHMRQLYNGR